MEFYVTFFGHDNNYNDNKITQEYLKSKYNKDQFLKYLLVKFD